MASKKDLLLQTASALFAQKGYHGTSLSDILQESQVPKGSLYYYFPGGKEELAAAAIAKAAAVIAAEIQEHGKNQVGIAALTHHLTALADTIESLESSVCPFSFSLLALESRTGAPAVREACRQGFLCLQEAYASFFEQDGFSAETAAQFSQTISSCIEGALVLCAAEGSGNPLRQQISVLQTLYLTLKENRVCPQYQIPEFFYFC